MGSTRTSYPSLKNEQRRDRILGNNKTIADLLNKKNIELALDFIEKRIKLADANENL